MQTKIALWFNIPLRLAHTVNIERAFKYIEHLGSPMARLERFMDGMEAIRSCRLRDGDNS